MYNQDMGGNNSTARREGRQKEILSQHNGSINCMTMSEDGSVLVTGSEDATARMWSTKSSETSCLGVLK